MGSGSSAILGDFYYLGDETYIERCQTLLATVKSEYDKNNKFFSGNFAIAMDKNSTYVYVYDRTPTFEFKLDNGLKKNVYMSDELTLDSFFFLPSDDTKVVSSTLDYSSPVMYLFSDNFCFFYTIGSFVNTSKPSEYPYIILTSFEMADTQHSVSGGVSATFEPEFKSDMFKPAGSSSLDSLPSNYFNMTVTNNFKAPVQIRMYITNKGEKYNIGGVLSGPTHTNFQLREWNCHFLYMTKDWVLAPDISTGDTSKDRLQYKPTEWHYINGNDTLMQTFNWAQINIIENTEYDLVVEYIPITDKETANANTTVNDNDIIETYRQTFSLYKRSVSYDRDTTEDFGVLTVNGYDDYLSKVNSADGYVDDDGKTQIKDTFHWNTEIGGGNFSSGAKNLYSGGGFSLTSLQSSTASVLGFFKYVFNFFPSQVWNAFYFLVVVVVVFGFIRMLKG